MKTGILFDLDGTLLDTLADLADSVNHVLASFGYPQRTVEEVREIHREGMARRRQLSTELVDMREDLEKRLALPTTGNGTP